MLTLTHSLIIPPHVALTFAPPRCVHTHTHTHAHTHAHTHTHTFSTPSHHTLALFPGLPRGREGLVHTVRACAKFPDIPVIPWHSRVLSVFELPECREISAHARTVCTVYQAFPPGNEANHTQNTVLERHTQP